MPRMARAKVVKAIAGLGAGLVLLTGCNGSFAGMGRMDSATGRGSASLGFQVRCDEATQKVSGMLQYVDSSARTSISAKPNDASYAGYWYWLDEGDSPEGYRIDCDGDTSQGHYRGTYTGTVNGVKRTGTFELHLYRTSECRGGAEVGIVLDGHFDHYAWDEGTYHNIGCLTSGSVRPI